MSDDDFTLAELVAENGEFICRDISGGSTVRYVRIYCSTFYRFVDVTEAVMAALALPLVRAHGMHTAAVWGTDAQLAERIRAVVQPAPVAAPAARPSAPPPPPATGGLRVKVKSPAPTRPPRGGTAVR